MKGKSMALVQGAKVTSETFHIDQGGIALVIDSHLGGIHARNGGRVVCVNLEKDAHDGNYAQQMLRAFEDYECQYPGIVD
jgi:hypothetical protein